MDPERLRIDRGTQGTAPKATTERRSFPVGKVSFLLVGLVALWWFRAPILAKLDEARLIEVQAGKATRSSGLAASAVGGVAANGYIVAATRAALSADTPGRIIELSVEEGSVVKAGDVVARLYAKEFEAALAAAESALIQAQAGVERARAEKRGAVLEVKSADSRLAATSATLDQIRASNDLAQRELARNQELVEKGAIELAAFERAEAEALSSAAALRVAEAREVEATIALDRARADETTAEARVTEAKALVPMREAQRDQARATLDKTFVRAPFDGVVVLKDAEVGEVVSPNSQGGNSRGSVCTMVDFSSLEVQVDLPEKNLSAAVVDSPTNIYLEADPSKRYAGRVSRIWPTANRQKATVEVRIRFEAPDSFLRPDMSVRVVFDPEEPATADGDDSPKVFVPTRSIVTVDDARGVFLLEGDLVRFRALGLGAERSRRTVVVRGLEGGEPLVLDPPPSLSDGDRVRIADGS